MYGLSWPAVCMYNLCHAMVWLFATLVGTWLMPCLFESSVLEGERCRLKAGWS